MKLAKLRKRDGRVVPFDDSKVVAVVWKAAQAVGGSDKETAEQLAKEAIGRLEGLKEMPGVEDVQDMIEKVLIDRGHTQTAKAFILYRKKRQELREAKLALGVEDDMKLSYDGLVALTHYKLLRKTETGKMETPRQMFQRVASALSKAEKKYGEKPSDAEKKFDDAMVSLDLVPSIAILRNAGTSHHLSESYVLPLKDDTESLFDTLKRSALLHKSRQRGFGLGLSFSQIRAKGSPVGEGGVGDAAAGPVAFLHLYDRALHQLNPYGTNMAFLSVHHPDIVDFITAKDNARFFTFGTSVMVTRDFMAAVSEDKTYKLIDPHSGNPLAELRARSVFDMIATIAWRTGDPAVVFLDNLNKAPANPFGREAELIQATTPTGEHPLFFFEGSFTASVNLAHHVRDGTVDWDKLRGTVQVAVHLLDNALDTTPYPYIEMKAAIERTRRIGVGIMGWADMLIALGIAYNSGDALALAEKVMAFIGSAAKQASIELGKKRGVFTGFKESVYARRGDKVRHAARTTIMNSGILSMIAGCSQGVEPYYAISYMKRTPSAETFEVIPLFEAIARKEGFYSPELMKKIALAGSVQHIEEVPVQWRKLFVTAHDCGIQDHLAMQISFQKHTDNGVSKTINLPAAATIHEVEDIIRKAYRARCRSIHIYREGSSSQQLIHSRYNGKKKRVKMEV